MLGSYEWIIIELLVLAVLVYEMLSIRRSLKKDRAALAEKAEREGRE